VPQEAIAQQEVCKATRFEPFAPSGDSFRRCLPRQQCRNGSEQNIAAGGLVECLRMHADECQQVSCEPVGERNRVCRMRFDQGKSQNLTTVQCGIVGNCNRQGFVLCECRLVPLDADQRALSVFGLLFAELVREKTGDGLALIPVALDVIAGKPFKR